MSDVDISRLSSSHLPVKDSAGSLQDSPVEATSSSFLIFDDGGGYEGASQILELRLNGLTPENSNNGMLFLNMFVSPSTLFEIRKREYGNEYMTDDDLLVQCDLSSYTPGETLYFGGSEYHPEVSGSVKLSSLYEDAFIPVFVPLSTVVPLISEDSAYLISDMELYGVDANNSSNGVLEWEMTLDGGTFAFYLRIPGSSVVAFATGSIYSYPPFTCELAEDGYSGITGTVVFEGFAASSGHLIVRVNDGIRLPVLTGDGTRTLAVDRHGRIVALIAL